VPKLAREIVVLAGALLFSCSRQKTVSIDDLRSDITAGESLAAEEVFFIDYLNQHAGMRHFAQGHMQYLTEEAARSAKQLQESKPAPGADQQLELCRNLLARLHEELSSSVRHIGNPAALLGDKQALIALRSTLEQARSAL
jgi:hypothetical protein